MALNEKHYSIPYSPYNETRLDNLEIIVIPRRDKKLFFSEFSYSMDNGVFLQYKSDGP